MPSTVTHSYFIMDIYEKLPINRKIFLKDEIDSLKVFAQGMDPLYFYFSLNIKRKNKINDLGIKFHKEKTCEYIINLINYIKYNYYKNNPEVMSYLYGIISHYVLDSTIHPYVYYKTGCFGKLDKNTYKYNGYHHILETNIDSYLIKTKEKMLPRKYKHYKHIFKKLNYSKDLKDVIDFSFKEVYTITNFSKFLFSSIKNMKLAYRILRYDKYGIKYNIYKCFDKITSNKFQKISFLSYNCKITDKNYLNNKKEIWVYPTNNRKKYTSSFIELYIKALNESLYIIKNVDLYIYNDKKTNLKTLLKNRSYITGIDLNKNQSMKYFKN